MISARVVQRGCGRGRDPWRIRQHLSTLGLNMSDVARMADTYPQVAQETVNGTRNHRRVLAKLEELECPKKYLYGSNIIGRAA